PRPHLPAAGSGSGAGRLVPDREPVYAPRARPALAGRQACQRPAAVPPRRHEPGSSHARERVAVALSGGPEGELLIGPQAVSPVRSVPVAACPHWHAGPSVERSAQT